MASRMSTALTNDKDQVVEENEEEEEEEEDGSVSPTEVKMSQIVLPCHCNHQQELCVGQLLKWIDITACLSGKASLVLKSFHNTSRCCNSDSMPSACACCLRIFSGETRAVPLCHRLHG